MTDETTSAIGISQEEYQVMMQQRANIPAKLMKEFHRQKYQRECLRNWDIFYKRNGDRFFKDRHWTYREFPSLAQLLSTATSTSSEEHLILLELGCGVGNFLYPLASQASLQHCFLGCDLSPRAVAIARENPEFDADRMHFWQHDIVSQRFFISDQDVSDVLRCKLGASDEQGCIHLQVDIVSCIFVLSALSTDMLQKAVENISRALKTGGTLIIRDYAQGDHAQIRFQQASNPNQVDEHVFVRHDGTLSHFFTLPMLNELFARVGLEMKDGGGYVKTITRNRKEGLEVERIFVQAEYTKVKEI